MLTYVVGTYNHLMLFFSFCFEIKSNNNQSDDEVLFNKGHKNKTFHFQRHY